MKLILTQPEIEQILRDHVKQNVKLACGDDYTIDFVATRSGDGVTATIEIPYLGVTSLAEVVATKVTPKAETVVATTVLMNAETANVANASNPNPVVAPSTNPLFKGHPDDVKSETPSLAPRTRGPGKATLAKEAAAASTDSNTDMPDPDAGVSTPDVDLAADDAVEQPVLAEAAEVEAAPPADTKPRKSLFG